MLLASVISFSQTDTTTTNNNLNIEWVTVIGSEPIDIEKADRVFYKIKFKPDPKVVTTQSYEQLDFAIRLSDLNPKMRIPKMPGGEIPLLYGNYVKLGFGNYVSPLAQAHFGSKRNEKYSYGLNLNHRSAINGPIDKSNSGYSTNSVEAFGDMYTNKVTIGSRLDYARDLYKFYGYPTDSGFVDQENRVLNNIGLQITLDNKKSGEGIMTSNQFGFYQLSDNLESSELGLQLNTTESLRINDNVKLNLNLGGQFANYKVIDSSAARLLLNFGVNGAYNKDKLELSAGFNSAVTNDTITSGKKFHFYPAITSKYELQKNLSVFGNLSGNVNWKSWKSTIYDNPLLVRGTPIYNENEFIKINGGVQGVIKTKLNYTIELGYRRLDNLATYMNDSLDQSRFNILYDTEGASNIYTKASLTYSQNDKLRSSLSLRLNQWNTESLDLAWHLPNTEATLNLRYKILDKMYINTDFYYISGIQAFDFDLNKEISLDKITDLSIGFDYQVSKKFSSFLNFNNVLSGNYQRYFKYPSQGINILGGLTYTF